MKKKTLHGQPWQSLGCHSRTRETVQLLFSEEGQYRGLWREGPFWSASTPPTSMPPFMSSMEDRIIWKTQSDATQDIWEGDIKQASSLSSCRAAGPQPDW